MGVLSDLVVAPATDAERVGRTPAPSQAFGGLDIKGIDSVRFMTLHSLLMKRDFDSLLPEYEPTFSESEEGPWVFTIPPSLVSRLAVLTEPELRAAAAKWAQTEEFQLDGWQPALLVTTLTAICLQAAKAETSRQALYLWMI